MVSGQTFLWVISLNLSGTLSNTPRASKDKCPLSLVSCEYNIKVLDTQGMPQAAICREEAGGILSEGVQGHCLWKPAVYLGRKMHHLNKQFSIRMEATEPDLQTTSPISIF